MAYKDKVQFFLVYTREIHPTRKKDDSSSEDRPSKKRKGPSITQHESMQDRVIAADACMKGLKLTLPTLLDTMDNTYTKAYSGMPAGTAIIDIDGKIAYWNRGEPRGCKPDKAEEAIKKLLEKDGGAIPAEWAAVKVPSAPLPFTEAAPVRSQWF